MFARGRVHSNNVQLYEVFVATLLVRRFRAIFFFFLIRVFLAHGLSVAAAPHPKLVLPDSSPWAVASKAYPTMSMGLRCSTFFAGWYLGTRGKQTLVVWCWRG